MATFTAWSLLDVKSQGDCLLSWPTARPENSHSRPRIWRISRSYFSRTAALDLTLEFSKFYKENGLRVDSGDAKFQNLMVSALCMLFLSTSRRRPEIEQARLRNRTAAHSVRTGVEIPEQITSKRRSPWLYPAPSLGAGFFICSSNPVRADSQCRPSEVIPPPVISRWTWG